MTSKNVTKFAIDSPESLSSRLSPKYNDFFLLSLLLWTRTLSSTRSKLMAVLVWGKAVKVNQNVVAWPLRGLYTSFCELLTNGIEHNQAGIVLQMGEKNLEGLGFLWRKAPALNKDHRSSISWYRNELLSLPLRRPLALKSTAPKH